MLHTLFSLLFLILLICLLWHRTVRTTRYNYIFWPSLGLKLLCGIVLGIIYTENYDTYYYQQAADMLSDLALSDFRAYAKLMLFNKLPEASVSMPWFPTYSNSFFFIKPLSLLNFLTGRQYFLNSLFFSFFSFAGCWYFVKAANRAYTQKLPALVLSFRIFPSVVFWSSGILKESILLGSLCFFWATILHVVYRTNSGKVLPNLLLLIVAAYILWKIKFFVAALVFCLTGAWVGLKWLQHRYAFFRSGYPMLLALSGLATLLAIFISKWHESFQLEVLLRRLNHDYRVLQELSAGKPVIQLSHFEPTISSVLSNIPEALAGVFFRPFIWEGTGIFYRVAGLENLVLLVLFAGSMPMLWHLKRKQLPGFYGVLLVYILVLAIISGLSTPNLGTLNRYRVAFLPFLVFLLLQTPSWSRLLARLSRRREKPAA